jgi:hypothetical protein
MRVDREILESEQIEQLQRMTVFWNLRIHLVVAENSVPPEVG